MRSGRRSGASTWLRSIRSDAPNEIPAQWLDSAKAMDRLGWTPALTLDAGLQRTVPWYREALA